jgi:hypothetical protein
MSLPTDLHFQSSHDRREGGNRHCGVCGAWPLSPDEKQDESKQQQQEEEFADEDAAAERQ